MRILVPAVLALLLGIGLVPATAQEPDPQPQEGVEPLARGPVHEAFAQPATDKVGPPDVVPQQPPEPIPEIPPDEKPDGKHVEWIPGYWDWDDDGEEFLWVSGFWRDLPPDRKWVPGHWQKVKDGWQWVRGFWAADADAELEYVPPPPASLDVGPSTPCPGDDFIYVPGCWMWRDRAYAWRPGTWLAHRPDYVWVPCQYMWTPSGCVFVNGFWDHPLHCRGLLFAPCRITSQLLAAQWRFRPCYCVRPDFLLGALFVNSRNRCYCFGDFFAQRCLQRGIVPWLDYRVGRGGCDPNFCWYQQAFRGNAGWVDSLRGLYQGRFAGDIPRPPTNLVQQAQAIKNINAKNVQNNVVNKNVNITNVQNVTALNPIKKANNLEVTGLAQLGKDRDAKPAKVIKLQEVNQEQRERQQAQAEALRQAAQQREKAAARFPTDGGAKDRPKDQPAKLVIPKVEMNRPPEPVPIKDKAPPQMPKVEAKTPPKIDPPKPRDLPPPEVKAPPEVPQPKPVNQPKPAAPPPPMPKPEVKPLPRMDPPKAVKPPPAQPRPNKPRRN